MSNGVTGFHQFDVREVPFRLSENLVEPHFLNGLNCAVVESMKRNEEPLRRDVCCVLNGHHFHGNRFVRLFIRQVGVRVVAVGVKRDFVAVGVERLDDVELLLVSRPRNAKLSVASFSRSNVEIRSKSSSSYSATQNHVFHLCHSGNSPSVNRLNHVSNSRSTEGLASRMS